MNDFSFEERERAAHLARAGKTDPLVELLGGRSPDILDAKGDSLLMLAAYHGNAGTVMALLLLGADPELRNPRGWSPLDGAAFKGDLEVIQTLLDCGAQPDAAGPDGRTPLMWAAAFNRSTVVEALIERGADPTRRDVAGLDAATHAQSMGADATYTLLTGRAA
ncbi:ankyrin repeat domain-containing protein [Polyangium sp. 15x6]|uniref:ankyrin repeat domain-containing protein n=1 Tax=Polyangium sp. 15x6 TaxID=3042687 RepID=UPI00249A069B|nr:ankyrin repeat domain-containing protein [Polyangium sp. 15x6]MDI3284738.1 ankyrin repeat domain-containing protein [Polyangium sp. 15x6]